MMPDELVDVPVIDAHHHLTRLKLGYPWLMPDAPVDRYHGDDTALREDYLIDQYRADMSELPLIGSIHVENGAADPLGEAEWIGTVIADQAPVPAAHVARADLSDHGAQVLLERLAAMPHVRGIRHILNWHPDPRVTHTPRPHIMEEPHWRGAFGRLAGLGFSFDLQVFAEQLEGAARLAGEHPETQIILDHVGMPLSRDPEYLKRWSAGLRTLARHPNVSVKISAIGTTDHRWSVDSIAPLVLGAIDTFGPDRAMFASNFPVDGMYSTASELYAAFNALSARYTRSEREALFAGTAMRVYRIGEASG